MNEENVGTRCPQCGSSSSIVGPTHYECEVCGCLLDELTPESGFVPMQTVPRVLRRSTDRNSLGTRIDESGDGGRIRNTHSLASSNRPLFIDIAIGELVRECGTSPASVDAAHLLVEVDGVARLGRIRRRMRGSEGMGADESREYRARAFAAAALHIRGCEGQSNTAPQVARDWKLRYVDLALAIRILNRYRRTNLPSQNPSERRARELRQELDRIRNFLSEQLDMEFVNAIIESAVEDLKSSGEPLYPGDEWLTGPMCNTPSPRAVFETIIRSMAKLGVPLESARELYQRLPISGMAYFMERVCPSLFD